MTSWRLLPLALLATLALASCEKENAVAPAATELLAARWLLLRVDGQPIATATATSPPYLEFVDLGSCTVGLGPCNNFSGRFRLDGGGQQLHITPQIPTRATCPAQALETRYLANLAHTTRYRISHDELGLFDADANAPLLEFRRAGP